ncbi:MAG TPA: FAD-dependent thymidylate synthase [Syntrophales bacterium]|nr:FAD-dependent thymidylate synthase [Syntrophales bacterium]
MKVILAGYNLDADVIEELKKNHPDRNDLTPETISAAYARISRNPLAVDELRREARKEVDKARSSNRNIVFGMGHSSIAEHTVFNIDVLGVSRLVVEEIEKFRLCSYTEKSQRYVLLTDDFVIPEEVRSARLEAPFVETVRAQNSFYQSLFERLRDLVFRKHEDLARDPANRSTLEGWAKEDARYILSLATETQLGMTLNARNLEHMLRRLAAHPLAEAKECARRLYDATAGVAPSLVRYTDPTPFDLFAGPMLAEEAEKCILKWGKKKWEDETPRTFRKGNVNLYSWTPSADEFLVASLIHAAAGQPMERCLSIAGLMDREEKEELVKKAFSHMKAYDAPPREFENIDLHFEAVVSASCFAQLKRHRMATIVSQDYDPALGITIPPSVLEVGMKDRFREIISRTEDLYGRIRRISPAAAGYILTNAHRRRTAIKVNARELYHMSRLRADRHAQWDIRETCEKMLSLGRRVMPLTLMLAAGKDGFASLYSRIFPDEDSSPRQ